MNSQPYMNASHVQARSGRIFDVRTLEIDRVASVADTDDILAVLALRKTNIRKRLVVLRTANPADRERAIGEEHRARDALEWTERRISQVKARRAFLLKDGDQNWSTTTLGQRFMEAARQFIGPDTFEIILEEAKRRG